MKNISLYFLLGLAFIGCSTRSNEAVQTMAASIDQTPVATSVCLSAEEEKLFNAINSYRKSKKLKLIPYSASLSKVAQLHAKDLALKNPNKQQGCNLHSWSVSKQWKGCCYTSDHKQASCMWDKPRELTSYPGNGYEISTYSSASMTADLALKSWKESPPHHDVILSKSIWKDAPWKAMGVGVYKGYAMVWFGNDADTDAVMKKCK